MFNLTAFSEEVRDRREEALALVGTNSLIRTYRDALRILCDSDAWHPAPEYVAPAQNAETLRAELSVAAMAAYLSGATRRQIDVIVALCTEKDDFAPMGCTRLTKAAASRLIDDLKR